MKILVLLIFATSRARSIPAIDVNHQENNLRLKLLAYQNATSIRQDSHGWTMTLI